MGAARSRAGQRAALSCASRPVSNGSAMRAARCGSSGAGEAAVGTAYLIEFIIADSLNFAKFSPQSGMRDITSNILGKQKAVTKRRAKQRISDLNKIIHRKQRRCLFFKADAGAAPPARCRTAGGSPAASRAAASAAPSTPAAPVVAIGEEGPRRPARSSSAITARTSLPLWLC